MNPIRSTPRLIMLCWLLVGSSTLFAQSPRRGIEGRPAPAWQVERWFNLPEGTDTLDVSDFRGKVVYLYGFQAWCPGCHSRGFPTLKTLSTRFADADDVAFVAIQTTFEGFDSNTAARAKAMGERYGLEMPIGHSGSNGTRSRLMQDYRTGGTPWTIVIDKTGRVRFNDFHLDVETGARMIEKLRKEPDPEPAVITLPPERGGQDVVGTRMPELAFDATITPVTRTEAPKATLYRWWTTGCHWCRDSLPAIETLRRRYEDRGLRTVGVFHPKPPRPVGKAACIEDAKKLGYRGDLAVDEDWSELKRFYLDTGRRKATSVTFLVDAEGVIRFVHPGPVFHPSDDPEKAEADADYRALEAAIRLVLDEEPAKSD